MTKPIKKISVILVFIIIMPVVFLLVREINSLNENERVIQDIYKKQLEAILFSVNQYSEDIVRSWSVELATFFENKNPNDTLLLKQLSILTRDNKSISQIFISGSNLENNYLYRLRDGNISLAKNDAGVKSILSENDTLIKRLFQYRASNFIKIEPLNSKTIKGQKILIFALDEKRICGLVLKPVEFVKQNLAPKIQSVERDEFSVAVFDSSNGNTIFSTQLTAKKYQQSKHLWLFPDYLLGISLRGTTIENLVRQRTSTNLIIIVSMALLMLIAAWFGYKNIKQEVDLAQIKSDFVSNVSHELRTPLALINMFAETLSMGRVKNEAKRDEYYRIIQQEIERLSKIVNKILSFSKIESGKWKYTFTTSDLNSIVEKIYGTYKFHLQNQGFEFVLESSGEELNAYVDPETVSEAVINLLDNAVKYSGDRKKIMLRTGSQNGKVFVEVEDEGIGISYTDQKKIFDKFYRVTSGNIHNTKGTGLGLTLVSHIMEAHNGEIKLTSEIGKGSSFILFFPVNQNK